MNTKGLADVYLEKWCLGSGSLPYQGVNGPLVSFRINNIGRPEFIVKGGKCTTVCTTLFFGLLRTT